MRIRQLRLLRYGKFTGHTLNLPASAQDIHLIVGPNEAGKSTVRHAIADWLFGFPERTPHAFLHPMAELRLGGLLESAAAGKAAPVQSTPARRATSRASVHASGTASLFDDDLHADTDARTAGITENMEAGGKAGTFGTQTLSDTPYPERATSRLDFERTKGRKNTLRTADDSILPDDILHAWLGNLQREAFARMYALDHTTLVEGSEGMLRASDDIGRMLFQSAAGIEHLGEALKQLQQEADALWAPRKSASRLYYRAADSFDQARKDLAHAQLRTKDWRSRRDALADTGRELEAAQQRSNTIQQGIHRLERIRRVQPLLLTLDDARQKLEALAANGMPPLLAEDAPQIFQRASSDRVLIEAEIRRLNTSIRDTENTLAKLPVDEATLREADGITRLNEQRLQYRDHSLNLLKHGEEIRGLWIQVQRRARELGWPCNREEDVRQRLPARPARTLLHRLIREHGERRQALVGAQTTQAGSRRLMDQARQSLEALDNSPLDNDRLRQAVDRALKLGDHEGSLNALQQRQTDLARKLVVALDGMGAWRQPAETLAGMLVPDITQVRELIEQHRQDAGELKSLHSARDATDASIRQLDIGIQQLVQHYQPVSREDVRQARTSRDSIWQAIRQTPGSLPEQADAFEAQTREADELADARVERAQHEAERQASHARLLREKQQLAAIGDQIAHIEARMQRRLDGWLQRAETCGLPRLPLEMAPAWLQQRQQALHILEEKTSLDDQQARLLANIADVQQTLGTLLNASAATLPDLSECVRQARTLLSRAEQARGERKTLEAHIRQEQQNLVRLDAELETARKEWQSWENRWQQALGSAGFDTTMPVEHVEAQLAQLDDIDTLLERSRQLQQERIEPMQAELDGFAASARSLAGLLAPELTEKPASDIAQSLSARLDEARRAHAEAVTLRKRIDDDRAALDDNLQKQVALQAAITPLLAAAGVQDLDALASLIDASTRRRQLEQAIGEAERQLIAHADGKTPEELRNECADTSPDMLRAQLDDLQQQATRAVEEIKALAARQGQQRADLAALDGNDAAARAVARQQEAVADMTDAAEQWLQLQTAIRLLSWSIGKFRETRQGPLLARASRLFGMLTQGSFNRLLVDTADETPRLFGIRSNHAQVPVPGMSEGSRDQLYLALRLAALDMQVDQGQTMPLIADDLFINFDDQRTAAGLQVLGEMSRRMQVIFLTHHAHLVPLARKVLGNRLNVIELA